MRHNKPHFTSDRRLLRSLMLCCLLASSVALIACGEKSSAGEEESVDAGGQRWTVGRGDLTISVLAPGSIRAKNTTVVSNQVPGDVKIIWVIEEGKIVKKGDRLVELEANELSDRINRQLVEVTAAQARYDEAVEELEIQESQNRSDLLAAENKLKLADLDNEKYIEGDYPKSRREREKAITLAEAELTRAEEKLFWTEKLLEKGYVSSGDLKADELSVTKQSLELINAKADLELLEKYEKPRELSKLETAILEAQESLTRVKHNNQSRLRNKQIAVESNEAKLKLEQDRLSEMQIDLSNTIITAPEDGMVVYAQEGGWRNQESQIQAGTQVRRRQKLIELPDFSAWQVDTRVHESMVQQIKTDQIVHVTLDAFSNAHLDGKISKVGVLPDSGRWFQPDTKEYVVEVDLTTTTLPLKPGMSTRNEIIIEELKDVVYVPLQAVYMVDGKPQVKMARLAGGQQREVKVGRNNDRFVEITDGLKPGDEILLTAMPAEATLLLDRPSEQRGPKGKAAPAQDEASDDAVSEEE